MADRKYADAAWASELVASFDIVASLLVFGNTGGRRELNHRGHRVAQGNSDPLCSPVPSAVETLLRAHSAESSNQWRARPTRVPSWSWSGAPQAAGSTICPETSHVRMSPTWRCKRGTSQGRRDRHTAQYRLNPRTSHCNPPKRTHACAVAKIFKQRFLSAPTQKRGAVG